LLGLIGGLAKDGYGIIVTTHNPDHVLLLGGTAAVLDRDGHLESGSARDIVTEDRLRGLYRTDVRIAYVKEAGREACVTPSL